MHRTVDKQRRYCLELGNGLGWTLTATERVRFWLEKFASILELTACGPNGHPRLIFIPHKAEHSGNGESAAILDSDRLKDLPQGGWTKQTLGALRFWSHPRVSDMICETGQLDDNIDEIVSMWWAVYPIFRRVQESDGLPLHAALVGRNGVGVLLAAPGGTGKSTCCRRLPSPWHALCDDETVIARDHGNRYLAHPFPTWSESIQRGPGRKWNVQHCLPLSAVFFLEQAETDEAVPIGKGETSALINRLAVEVSRIDWRNLPREEKIPIRKKLFHNACELAKSVPAFKLRVSLNGRFWQEMERVLSEIV
ncbi:MAG: SynChlorMet cassette protein ScmC [Proteobacteria bacterium]|nr:SynChlorMet cassette protein ScmC [Pseudomonadota bacterium]